MRQFYETYANDEKLAPMVREIGWIHNLTIMKKWKDARSESFTSACPVEIERLS
jgi:hypothetical protein